MRSTGPFVITGSDDRPVYHDHGTDHGIRANRFPASSRKPESLLHEEDVLLDVVHRRDEDLRDRPRAFDGDVAAGTRRARDLDESAFFFGFAAGR